MTVARATVCSIAYSVWAEKRECRCTCYDTAAQTKPDTAAQKKQ